MENRYKWSVPKILIALSAAAYFLYCARTYTEWHFLDYINLIFHEAGHTLALFFPTLIHVMAGTFFQLFIPFVCFLHLYYNRYYFSAHLTLFWLGQNFFNVAHYASDAQMMILPLLGGDGTIHDWNYILGHFDLLRHTDAIAEGIYFIGIVIIAAAATLSFLNAKDKLNPDIDRAI